MAGQPSQIAEAEKALEQTKAEALSVRDLEVAWRAIELAEQERVAFLANNEAEFERHFADRYREAAQKVEDAEQTIVAAYAAWQEANRRHFAFRHAIGRSTDNVPQTPAPLRDTSRAVGAAREARAAA